jgi:hypothetical protein
MSTRVLFALASLQFISSCTSHRYEVAKAQVESVIELDVPFSRNEVC